MRFATVAILVLGRLQQQLPWHLRGGKVGRPLLWLHSVVGVAVGVVGV
jgi:hypothetical protein